MRFGQAVFSRFSRRQTHLFLLMSFLSDSPALALLHRILALPSPRAVMEEVLVEVMAAVAETQTTAEVTPTTVATLHLRTPLVSVILIEGSSSVPDTIPLFYSLDFYHDWSWRKYGDRCHHTDDSDRRGWTDWRRADE